MQRADRRDERLELDERNIDPEESAICWLAVKYLCKITHRNQWLKSMYEIYFSSESALTSGTLKHGGTKDDHTASNQKASPCEKPTVPVYHVVCPSCKDVRLVGSHEGISLQQSI